MGRTQCFRANAAYSLYGVKAGQTDSSGSSGCLKKTYINSFFTNMGVESFTDPFGIDAEDYGASSECESKENGGDRKLEDGYSTSYAHGHSLFDDYTSYGTGCSKNGKFVLATFDGAYCNGGHHVATTDDLDYLNSDLDGLGCKQIYGGQQGGRKLGDNNEDIATTLLSYSTVCNMLEYPTKCPDPYGLKASHESSLKKAADKHFKKVSSFMPIMSTMFCAGALFFLYLTEKTKYSTKTKNIDTSSPEPMPEPPIILRAVGTFSRTASALSLRAQSFKEKLIDYAEAENDEGDQIDDTYVDQSYQRAESIKSMQPSESVESVHSNAAALHSAETFSRTATDLSMRTSPHKEKLFDYAEAENDEDDQMESIKSMHPSESIKSVHSNAVALHSAETFSRTATDLSMRPSSIKEKLFDYAEAKNDEDDQMESIESMLSTHQSKPVHTAAASVHYVAPPVESQPTTEPEPTPAQAPKEDESQIKVANAMLAEKGIAAKPKAEMKKFKRPRLARITKFLFRKRNRATASATF